MYIANPFHSQARGIEGRISRLGGEAPHLRTYCENALNTRDRLVRQLSKMQDEHNAQVMNYLNYLYLSIYLSICIYVYLYTYTCIHTYQHARPACAPAQQNAG